MHLPVGGEEHVDVGVGEEIRRAVRTIEHADFPGVAVGGNQRGGQRLADVRGFRCREVQHVADPQGAPGVAAELAEGEGGLAAEVVRHVEAAAHRKVGAAAGVLDRRRVSAASRP